MPAHRVPIDPGENAAADPGRRRALKLGAALGAGTIVWAEPTIKGLARRPAYAAVGSDPTCFVTIPLSSTAPGDILLNTVPDGDLVITFSITVEGDLGGADEYVLSASYGGGACSISPTSATTMLTTDQNPGVILTGAVVGNVMRFAGGSFTGISFKLTGGPLTGNCPA